MLSKKIIGVQVFLERRSNRLYVGLLKRVGNAFHFEYDKNYLKAHGAVRLGPEMPLTRPEYYSESLFVPFLDRIPLRENPAYGDYCSMTGISINETDPFVLLYTIAHRGPSSFIFEPLYEDPFTPEDLLKFRKSLHLSVKDFAGCFEFSPAAVTRVERRQSSGREVLKRAEIYYRFPQVALDQLRRCGIGMHSNKQERVAKWLQERARENARIGQSQSDGEGARQVSL